MDYHQSGNRYTAIFVKAADGTLKRAPFDIVRFNVDSDPGARRYLVPVGMDAGKVFEKVWVTDKMPWKKKVSFDGIP